MNSTKQIKNLALLFIAALIWGSTFVAQSSGMDYVGPFTFLCSRSFLGGGFLAIYIALSKLISTKKRTLPDLVTENEQSTPQLPHASGKKTLLTGGLILGFVMLISSGIQQIGIQYTSVGKASFLTAMYVIFVPILSFIIFKKKLQTKIYLCVILSVVGMALLCLKIADGDSIIEFGDFLELLCAVAFSVHILVVDYYSCRVNPVKLSCIQFFACGIFSAIPMLIFENPSINAILHAWLPIAYAGILSSGIAFTLQAVAQKNCDPTLASLVMCLESVFGAVFGWIILGQAMSVREIIGCVLMFAAIVISNLPDRKNT